MGSPQLFSYAPGSTFKYDSVYMIPAERIQWARPLTLTRSLDDAKVRRGEAAVRVSHGPFSITPRNLRVTPLL